MWLLAIQGGTATSVLWPWSFGRSGQTLRSWEHSPTSQPSTPISSGALGSRFDSYRTEWSEGQVVWPGAGR
jgi:hypothetical protein